MKRLVALWLIGCLAGGSAARGAPVRVISLAPSLTEIAYAIGCGDRLIADTKYDDYPEAATRLPHVSDMAHADLEQIAQLQPTAILALHDQEKEGNEISQRIPVSIEFLPNRNLDDLFADIAGVGRLCGTQTQATAYATQMKASIDAVRCDAKTKPRVLVLFGLPGFTAGRRSYVNDLIDLAGGQNVAGNIDQPYPNLGDEAIIAADPDVIIVSNDTPFGSDVQAREPWSSLRAVKDHRIERPPNDDIIERNGPRVVQGLQWLAKGLCQRGFFS